MREELVQAVTTELRGPRMRDARGAENMNAAFTDALVRTLTAMVPPPPREPRTGGWCSDPEIQHEMDEAWEYRQTVWK